MDAKKSLPILLAVAAAAMVGFLLLKPNNEPSTTSALTQTSQHKNPESIVIKNGEPVGGVAMLTYKQGSTVHFSVTSDATSGDVHVHGYDIEEPVAPGKPARFVFVAKDGGRFEVELHPSTRIAQLDVVP